MSVKSDCVGQYIPKTMKDKRESECDMWGNPQITQNDKEASEPKQGNAIMRTEMQLARNLRMLEREVMEITESMLPKEEIEERTQGKVAATEGAIGGAEEIGEQIPIIKVSRVKQSLQILNIVVTLKKGKGWTEEVYGIVDTGMERCIVCTKVLEDHAPELLNEFRPQ